MKRGDIRTASATATASVFLGERSNRRGIILFPPAAGSYTVSDSPSITNGEGVYLTATSQPVILDSSVVGDLTQQSLFVVASGSVNFGFIEITE